MAGISLGVFVICFATFFIIREWLRRRRDNTNMEGGAGNNVDGFEESSDIAEPQAIPPSHSAVGYTISEESQVTILRRRTD